MKKSMSEPDWAAWMLVMVGALNLGLVGVFKFDAIQTMLGTSPIVVRILHILIGVSGAYWMVKTLKK